MHADHWVWDIIALNRLSNNMKCDITGSMPYTADVFYNKKLQMLSLQFLRWLQNCGELPIDSRQGMSTPTVQVMQSIALMFSQMHPPKSVFSCPAAATFYRFSPSVLDGDTPEMGTEKPPGWQIIHQRKQLWVQLNLTTSSTSVQHTTLLLLCLTNPTLRTCIGWYNSVFFIACIPI